jgi:hypothetical protein
LWFLRRLLRLGEGLLDDHRLHPGAVLGSASVGRRYSLSGIQEQFPIYTAFGRLPSLAEVAVLVEVWEEM